MGKKYPKISLSLWFFLSHNRLEDIRREIVDKDVTWHVDVLVEGDDPVVIAVAHRDQAVNEVLQLLLSEVELERKKDYGLIF